MSAHPFGHAGFIRFKEYLYWAAESQKCRVQTGYCTLEDGEVLATTTITAPSGNYVIEVDVHGEEFLPISRIAYYDRRLGLRWPGSSTSGVSS